MILWLGLLLTSCAGSTASRPLGALTWSEITTTCDDIASRSTALTCDGVTATTFDQPWTCQSVLAEVDARCEHTVRELMDCIDVLDDAGCDATLDHPDCVELLDPTCGVSSMLSGLLGPVAGVPGDTALTDIDTALWRTICEVVVTPEDPIECEGFTIEPVTVESCVAGSDIDWIGGCTLDPWMACATYEPSDPCDFNDLGPCIELFDCVP